ncbi:MAG: PepSY domain-containing protein [Alphaproteobacteria bacterium]|nr:PepSY domain-containing protein [Alphaproteobacteria bacterium]
MKTALMILALILTPMPGLADGKRGHEAARAAVEAGEIVPLGRILDAATRDFGGTMLEVELERERGRWVYEVKLLLPGGRVVEAHYDAGTATLMREDKR